MSQDKVSLEESRKQCRICKLIKPLDDFSQTQRSIKTGKILSRANCKECEIILLKILRKASKIKPHIRKCISNDDKQKIVEAVLVRDRLMRHAKNIGKAIKNEMNSPVLQKTIKVGQDIIRKRLQGIRHIDVFFKSVLETKTPKDPHLKKKIIIIENKSAKNKKGPLRERPLKKALRTIFSWFNKEEL